ncbi:MAG: M13 family metallopeptidase, partial [Prevotellaceae bacterium]|nr:M13 family metallopeptidase [Prevotellaceae bacterium]
MLNAEGIDSKYFQELVVGQPDYLAAADKILASMTVEDLRTYMMWDLISSSTSALSDEVAAVSFDFFGKTMSGRQEDYPRWKKATSMVESVLGQALGKMYCERYFPAASKERMKTLVANLQKSLGERIQAQEWMSDATKAAALEKLSTFYVKIGYPDEWKDMSGLTIDPKKSLYENLMAARLFRNKQHIEETVGKPVNRDEWHMTPQTVNAYYNPTTNEICFPAGILQYPFFDAKADDAFNYGAIGVVIGHEMTHGFDDQGAHYDKDGNMSDWWSKEDVENFNKLGDQYAEFYNNIELLPGVNCNGRMTLGENLADHGGLQVAYNAYKAATANKPLKTVNGLTPDQRFFLAYAGVWGQNITEKETLNRLKNDVHSTGEWRVNGALPHINAWYEAFGVKKGDKLFVPESERLNLW